MKAITVFLFAILLQFTVAAQDINKISQAMESGSVASLSQYFSNSVDLTVLSTEGIYSKSQAKVILEKFFSENKSGVFTTKHEGKNDNSKYLIGTLVSKGKNYRVYFLFKTVDSKTLIQKLRIEND